LNNNPIKPNEEIVMPANPNIPPAPDFERRHNVTQELTFDIELLTPMLGGATESYRPDVSMPVRSQAVKGQLRFWWRTMQTAAATAVDLREREMALWGSVEHPSAVTVSIENSGPVKHEVYKQADAESKYPPYVLFPLPSIDDGSLKIITQHSFVLHLGFSADLPQIEKSDLENATKLWFLFGGVGARTRRGCGSLYCAELMETFQSVEAIAEFVYRAGIEEEKDYGASPWPRLKGGALFLSASSETDPTVAWKRLLDRYAGFRQGRDIGRAHGHGNRPGRSYWPEADALRRITGTVHGRHAPVHTAGNWFPRGAYGMPVEFEFRNEPTDPLGRKFFLQPQTNERWPSPVIMKIIKLADGSLIEACLILNAALPESIAVKEGGAVLHRLSASEQPLAHIGKTMPAAAPLHDNEHPYTALTRHLGLKEVQP
jgi:CRISPR-associated protein Cmr1